MKKRFLLILFFVAVFSFCMLTVFEIQGAELHGNVQLGYVKEISAFETEINLQFLPWQWLTLYGGVGVLMEYGGTVSYFPYRSTYTTGMKVNIDKIMYRHETEIPRATVYLDLYHHCVHPVYSYAEQFYDKFANGNKTMLSVGIEW